MSLKLCLALALAGAPFSAPASDPLYVQIDAVKMVDCDHSRGTAWRVGEGSYVTARHVITDTGCTIDGEPVTVTYQSEETDFASLRSGVYGAGLNINCDGFVDGEPYLAVGYAEGKPFQRAMFVIASDALTKAFPWGKFTVLYGNDRFIPGMSGGIVANRAGEVVGLVNGYSSIAPFSFSQSLSDTPLCA